MFYFSDDDDDDATDFFRKKIFGFRQEYCLRRQNRSIFFFYNIASLVYSLHIHYTNRSFAINSIDWCKKQFPMYGIGSLLSM